MGQLSHVIGFVEFCRINFIHTVSFNLALLLLH